MNWWIFLSMIVVGIVVMDRFEQLNKKIDELAKKDKPKPPDPLPDWYKKRLLP